MLLGAFAFCGLEAGFALSHWYLLSLLLIAAVGFAQMVFSAPSNTLIQTVTPDYLRGRVMSVYMMVFAGSIPPGNLLTGGLAHLWGAPITLLIEAVLSLSAVAAGWLLRAPAEKDLASTTQQKDLAEATQSG